MSSPSQTKAFTTKLLYTDYHPVETAFADDQDFPSSSSYQAFRSALLRVTEANTTPIDRSLPCIQELMSPDDRLSWPLSAFAGTSSLPPAAELSLMRHACLSRFDAQFELLRSMVTDSVSSICPLLDLAAASLGAGLLKSCHQKDIWYYCNRIIAVSISVNNTVTRNCYMLLAWTLNETAAIMSTDPDIWRLANIAHGFFTTAIRRTLSTHQIGPQFYQKFSLLARWNLQTDIVHAIRLGTLPTMAKSLGMLRLETASDLTISRLTNQLFDPENSAWTSASSDLILVEILLIITQTITYAIMWQPLSQTSICCESATLSSLSISNETRVTEQRIEHALSRWQACYLDSIGPQCSVLYHFCRIVFAAPMLIASTRQATGKTSLEGPVNTFVLCSRKSLARAAHHAWCLHENLTQIQSKDPSLIDTLLPTVTFVAALCVWQNIKAQDGSKSQGSLKVLELFIMELKGMPWPCCQDMLDFLRGVA